MNKNTALVTVSLALLVGIGGASIAASATTKKNVLKEENNALRMQLAALEKLQQRRPRQPSGESTGTTPAATERITAFNPSEEGSQPEEQVMAREEAQPIRESFQDRIARMKEENPQAYEEMNQRRQEFQEKIRYDVAKRTATFMDLDTSRMTPEERATHEQLVNRMGSAWEQMDMLENPAEISRESIRAAMENAREIRPLLDQERNTMFRLMAEDIGYKGESASAFAAEIDNIISATTFDLSGGGRSGGGGGSQSGRRP